MRRVIYAGEELTTGTAVAKALLHYTQYVIRAGTSVSLDIPVLNESGAVVRRTILLGPATQLDSQPVDGDETDDEYERFPIPELPAIGGKGVPSDMDPLPGFPEESGL